MVPIAFPGVVVCAIFSFLYAWGDLAYGFDIYSGSGETADYRRESSTSWDSTTQNGAT